MSYAGVDYDDSWYLSKCRRALAEAEQDRDRFRRASEQWAERAHVNAERADALAARVRKVIDELGSLHPVNDSEAESAGRVRDGPPRRPRRGVVAVTGPRRSADAADNTT